MMIKIVGVWVLVCCLYEVKADDNFNTTTLYPVNKFSDIKNISDEVINITDKPEINKESNEIHNETDIEILNKTKTEDHLQTKIKTKSETSTWSIDAVLSQPKLEDEAEEERLYPARNITKANETEDSKNFKPSQQLGSFYDENTFVIPTVRGIGSFTPSKPSSFIRPQKDFFQLNNKRPKEYLDKPYKENNFYKPTKPESGYYDSKPTVEVPVKVPAGSLYKHPGPFKDGPATDSDDDAFGLEFHKDKEKEVKKYKNPWSGLLNLITALVPVGIIVSALTPSLVTIHSDNNMQSPYGNHFSRRSIDVNLPKISERCKRRLLCEIHSERYYARQSTRPKHCYKIPCDDPEGMHKVLSWLLAYHRSTGHRQTYTY